MEIDKIVIVTKKTGLEELVKRHGTVPQTKFYLESQGQSYEEFKDMHDIYKLSLNQVQQQLPRSYTTQVVDRDLLPTFHFGSNDFVIALGDPGIVVNTAKYVDDQPVLAVNPDPKRNDDVFTSCYVSQVAHAFQSYITDQLNVEQLTMAKAKMDDGQELYALNDIFIGRKTHVSARYILSHENFEERQSSSGIIVSTGSGSTGWLSSIYAGAKAFGAEDKSSSFDRTYPLLKYAVREPFPSKTTGAEYVTGIVLKHKPLEIISEMPEQGVVFGDGMESDYLSFDAGRKLTITPADKVLNLIEYDFF